ncbi:MAG: CCA tRNA nucleotidyltransferase [Thaumarchaeota archaeon]|nr:CCA tRNA nucleotidyltransferase [Nitrososphaerota archaeon]
MAEQAFLDAAQRVHREAARLVQPSKKEGERVGAVAMLAVRRVEAAVQRLNLEGEVVLGGSYAKGTWLRSDADIDIFVKLPVTMSRDDLEWFGETLGVSALKGYRPLLRYSEHPYVEGTINGVKVNIVVCYKVEKGGWMSAADRSPFHTDYVVKNFNDELRLETRLLKRFLKATGIYGADIRHQGFSGYVCEALILKFRGLEQVLEHFAKIREGDLIAVGDYDPSLVKQFASPVIILDPIDSKRNLGTAISAESVGKLILAARAFLRKPNISFFSKPRIKKIDEYLKKPPLLDGLAAVTFQHRPRPIDDLWGQLKRSVSRIENHINDKGFKAIRGRAASNEEDSSALIFLVESPALSPFEVRVGPGITMEKSCSEFLQKRRRDAILTWVRNDLRVCSLTPRKTYVLRQFLREITTKNLNKSGISQGLKKDLLRGSRILIGEQVLKYAEKHDWFREELTQILATDTHAHN